MVWTRDCPPPPKNTAAEQPGLTLGPWAHPEVKAFFLPSWWSPREPQMNWRHWPLRALLVT